MESRQVLEAAPLEAVIFGHGTGELLFGGGGVDGEVLDEAEPAGLGLVAAQQTAELLGGPGTAGHAGHLWGLLVGLYLWHISERTGLRWWL